MMRAHVLKRLRRKLEYQSVVASPYDYVLEYQGVVVSAFVVADSSDSNVSQLPSLAVISRLDYYFLLFHFDLVVTDSLDSNTTQLPSLAVVSMVRGHFLERL